MTIPNANLRLLLIIAIAFNLGAAAVDAATRRPAAELLLPYFEVALDGGRTTVFDVVNATDDPVPVRVTVRTKWGIAIGELDTRLTLAAREVLAVDLATWLVGGRLPGKTLTADDLRHAQAALGGEASARTGLYYSTPPDLGAAKLLIGSVSIEVDDRGLRSRPRALWGNAYVLDPAQGSAQGEALVDVSPRDGSGRCTTHVVRLLEGQGFDAGTELMIWSPLVGRPARDPRYDDERVETRIRAYDERGVEVARVVRYLEPLAGVRAGELGLPADFGWLRIETETESVVAVRYGAGDLYSVAVGAYCLRGLALGIELETRTNGIDADSPPGPWMEWGERIEWTYEVTNTSDVTLTAVQVTDNDPRVAVRCPDDTLLAGESMTCSSSGVATSCAYGTVGHVTAITLDGLAVRDFDPSHYRLRQNGALALEVLVDGQPAGSAPGPFAACNEVMEWTFEVRNTGGSPLDELTVTNDQDATVFCPRDRLLAGEAMTCTARIVAGEGAHLVRSVVTGKSPCGVVVNAQITSHYRSACPAARIDVETYTNGEDADFPPGPEILAGDPVEWIYVVSNPGPVTLSGVVVTDDGLGAVSCPRGVLVPGEAMVCAAGGVAVEGSHRNEARASATSAAGEAVSDVDASHYVGVLPPG